MEAYGKILLEIIDDNGDGTTSNCFMKDNLELATRRWVQVFGPFLG